MKLLRYISIIALAAATAVNAYADKTNFRWIKDIDYAKVRHFSQGHSAFQENGKWGFINTAGEVVVEPQYDECHDYHNGYAAVKVNGKWGYIDIKHNLVIAPEFQDVEDKVYAFSDSASGQTYWLAKSFVVLGDSFADRGEFKQAKATFESIKEGYAGSSEDDDVLEAVNMRLSKIETVMNEMN